MTLRRKRLKKLALCGALILAVGSTGSFLANPTNLSAELQTPPAIYQIDMSPFVIGDQGIHSTCWIYASSKAFETYVYNNLTPQVALNLSEEWLSLAYMYYVNDQQNTLETIGINGKDNLDYEYGGFGMAYFFERVVNTYGIMLESDFTVPQTVSMANFQTLFNEQKSKAITNFVENIKFSWIGEYPSSEGYYDSHSEPQNLIVGNMKEYIYNYGAICTGVDITALKGQGTDTLYVVHDNTAAVNHAMAIIGYDDNKIIEVDQDTSYTGAFLLLNSYGATNQLVYMPYDMMMPNISYTASGKSENNQILSNTFYISEFDLPDENSGDSGSTGGNEESGDVAGGGTTDDINPDAGEGDGNEAIVPDEEQQKLSLWETIMQKSQGEQIMIFTTAGILAIFILLAIGWGIIAGLKRHQTTVVNQSVLAHNFARYQAHRLELERQKVAIDEEIAQIREEQKRKKQRRLKRQFNKNLNTGGSGENNNISI